VALLFFLASQPPNKPSRLAFISAILPFSSLYKSRIISCSGPTGTTPCVSFTNSNKSRISLGSSKYALRCASDHGGETGGDTRPIDAFVEVELLRAMISAVDAMECILSLDVVCVSGGRDEFGDAFIFEPGCGGGERVGGGGARDVGGGCGRENERGAVGWTGELGLGVEDPDGESTGVGSWKCVGSEKSVMVAEVAGGDGDERSDAKSSADEFEDESPTRAGGSLSGAASADVIWTGDSDSRSIEVAASVALSCPGGFCCLLSTSN
jgi:hypothetical protein